MTDYERFLAGSSSVVMTIHVNWVDDKVNIHNSKGMDEESAEFRNSVREQALLFIRAGKKQMGKSKRVVCESANHAGRGFCGYLCRRNGPDDDYFIVLGDTAEDKMIAAINAYGREVGMEEDLVNKGKVESPAPSTNLPAA